MKLLPQAVRSVLCLLVVTSLTKADVVFLTDGNVLVVEKAWEEGVEVLYQAGGRTRTLPKSSVKRIQHQKLVAVPAAAAAKYGIALESPRTKVEHSTTSNTIRLQGNTSAVSTELLNRLRQNLKSAPSDSHARSEFAQALNSLASLQAVQGDLSAAKVSLEEALAVDKNDPTILANLALINYRAGNYRATEDLLLARLQTDKMDQGIHFLLGQAYYAQEKVAQAINQWNEALNLGPNSEISARIEKARRELGVHTELGVLQSAHFILRYDRKVSDYRLGQQILTALEGLYRQLSIDLTSQPPATIAVILYPDQAYFDITQAPSWSGALFDGKIRVPTKGLSSVTPELSAVLVHELTHAFIRSLPGRGCPSWFNEGVAQLQEGKSAASHVRWLAAQNKESLLIPLAALQGSFVGLPVGTASLAYIEGLAAVEFLVASAGKTSIRRVLDLMGQNYNFESAFQNVLHKNIEQFDTEWRESLSR